MYYSLRHNLKRLCSSLIFRVVVGISALTVTSSLALYYIWATPLPEKCFLIIEQMQLANEFARDQGELKDDPATKASYVSLSEKEQEVYCALYRAAWLHRDSVSVDGLSDEEVWDLYTRMRYDSPEIFELDFGVTTYTTPISTLAENYLVTVEFAYWFDRDETMRRREEMEAQIDSAIVLLDKVEGNRAKAAVLHDWLCEQTVYDDEDVEPMSHASYGAMCEGKAVCEGYALAFGLLCDRAGLPGQVIVGRMDYVHDPALAHAWNMISSDGEEFYVDTIFDDGWRISKVYFWRDKAFMDRKGYRPYENNVPTL